MRPHGLASNYCPVCTDRKYKPYNVRSLLCIAVCWVILCGMSPSKLAQGAEEPYRGVPAILQDLLLLLLEVQV